MNNLILSSIKNDIAEGKVCLIEIHSRYADTVIDQMELCGLVANKVAIGYNMYVLVSKESIYVNTNMYEDLVAISELPEGRCEHWKTIDCEDEIFVKYYKNISSYDLYFHYMPKDE